MSLQLSAILRFALEDGVVSQNSAKEASVCAGAMLFTIFRDNKSAVLLRRHEDKQGLCLLLRVLTRAGSCFGSCLN